MTTFSIISPRYVVKIKHFPSTKCRFQIHSMIYEVYAYLVRLIYVDDAIFIHRRMFWARVTTTSKVIFDEFLAITESRRKAV